MDLLNLILGLSAIALLIAVIMVHRRARKLNDALLQERELLKVLLNNIPDQIYFKDTKSRFIKVNPGVSKMLGMASPELLVGKTDIDFFRKEDAEAFRADDVNVMKTKVPLLDRVERGTVNGVETWMSTTKAPILDRDKNVVGIVGISRDITERIREQQQLSNIVSKARCILWNARVRKKEGGGYSWRLFVHASGPVRKEFGIDKAQTKGGLWIDQIEPEQYEKMAMVSSRALDSGASTYEQEFWIKADDGTPRWLKEDVQISKISDNEFDVVGVALDITERKRFEEQIAAANVKLERLAREDALTGLLNRRAIMEQAQAEWARWERFTSPFSVLILDVDNFKRVNDRYGHDAGDQALKQISENLKSSVRAVDRLGRYGGEEFVIVLPATTQEGALTVARKATECVRSTPLDLGGQTLNITVSIGAATVSKRDKGVTDLLSRADHALLDAKRNGKNRVETAQEIAAGVDL